jgi:cohesin domain-containing protein/carboxypeptidase family protein/dockerin type I repeat protein
MKSKPIFQVLVLLAVCFAALGNGRPVMAQEGTIVVSRDLTYWDATFVGFVDTLRFEQWSFTLNEAQDFVAIATPTTAGLTPLLILLDANGQELTRAAATLTSTQPAGTYSLQVQPQAGSGFYYLSLWPVQQPDQPQDQPPDQQPAGPSVATVVTPASVAVGQSAAVTVSLAGVPAEGYTSTEFTCTYDGAVVESSNLVTGSLFGPDPAVALNGPANGSFVLAIAGSTGSKAAADGSAFTFSLKGLKAGQTAVECKARVSKGDGALSDVSSAPGSLAVTDAAVLGGLTGQVHAGKPVTVILYNADGSVAGSATAAADGTFSVSAPAGTYTVVARAAGFLNAQGSATLTAGGASTLPAVSLPGGDIDGNGVIDQFDAMTIGMSYNTAAPAAADLNNDGVINVLDLELLAANYRKSGALAWQ